MTAAIHTNKGIMEFTFFMEDAPITVNNFITLAKKGYYDNITFHRVIPNFMIQTGDPTGTGSGGPGYTIADELTGNNQYHDRGVLSMANTGRPNSGGSQFFICHTRDTTKHLDRKHTVFGKITNGDEIIDTIRQGDTIEKIVISEESTEA
jgi:peptidyl-prolyl cis-trans isomerase B (cyclophilin B)